MVDLSACTIVSNNYLPFARVLAQSLRAIHPQAEFFVLIVDRPDPGIDYSAEDFRVVFADELTIPAFEHFAFKYSLLELNTAVKPFFLEHLRIEHDLEAVLYFDPDIKIYGDLTPLAEALDSKNLLLTPHLLAPLDDDFRPSERSILLSGVYNLGFLGLRFNQATLDFLRWWQRRLYSYCLHRIADGLFVDQRWMDLAPSLLADVRILRDPGYNVAYWNLANRTLALLDDAWRVNDVPLRFFHFSGVRIDDLERISKYQDRFRLRDRPDLAPLFENYRRDLQDAGWDELKDTPYAYGRFDNGIDIPDLGRSEIWRIDTDGERWSNPFGTQSGDSYFAWLQSPVTAEEEDAWLPRMALILWENRPDLQSAFPAPLEADHANYVRWLLSGEPEKAGIDARFWQDLASTEASAIETDPAVDPPAAELLSQLSQDAQFDASVRPRLPRIALLIREKRPDLQEAFPAPLGDSRTAFARWFVTFGRLEYQLPAPLWRPTVASLSLDERLRTWVWRLWRQAAGRPVDSRGSWRDFGHPG